MEDEHELTEAEGYVCEILNRCAEGAVQKAGEGNIYAAFEEFHVASRVSMMALNFEAGEIQTEHVDVMRQIAWAETELLFGYSARAPDDLKGVEALSETFR